MKIKLILLSVFSCVFINLQAKSSTALTGQTPSNTPFVAQAGGGVILFETRSEFLNNCPESELIIEDFSGGPGNITACSPLISAAGDSCFAEGEIQAGVELTNNDQDIGANMIYFPGGSFGVDDPGVGADSFASFTILNFTGETDVAAVAFDLYSPLGDGGPIEARIFGAEGLIETLIFNVTDEAFFVGLVAQEAIVSIELENIQGVIVELVTQLAFGICNTLDVEEIDFSNITISPNPTNGIVNITGNNTIENYEVYDVTGKKVFENYTNETNSSFDISHLNQGIYYLKITIENATNTYKIVKE